MTKWRTIDDWNAREVERCKATGDKRLTVYEPPQPEERLFVSQSGCLTHITRMVAVHRDGRRSSQALCGALSLGRGIPVEAELFACHACIRVAERRGFDSYSLVPETGCEATGGTRYLTRAQRRVLMGI